MKRQNFLAEADIFREKVFKSLRELREKQKSLILFEDIHLDHIGFKCDSHEEYQEILEYLTEQELITEKHSDIIGDREITLVKLSKQASNGFTNSIVEYIEICDQKPNKGQVSGFDHTEWYYKNDINKRQSFLTTHTYRYFQKKKGSSFIERKGYKKPLFKTYVDGTVIIFSQGELLWDIAIKNNPKGLVQL